MLWNREWKIATQIDWHKTTGGKLKRTFANITFWTLLDRMNFVDKFYSTNVGHLKVQSKFSTVYGNNLFDFYKKEIARE